MKIIISERQYRLISEQSDYAMDRRGNALAYAVGVRSKKDYEMVDRIIKITESQYRRLKVKGIISEQSSPFYAQEKTASGAVNPKGDYVYYAGGPIKKPQGAIDAKQLFPSGPPQGGYPRRVPLQQINNISSQLGNLVQI